MYVGSAIGQQNNYPAPAPASNTGQEQSARPRADVGVLTILSQEMQAVVRVLERAQAYQTRQLYGGQQAHEARFPVPGGGLQAVAMQALDRGPRSAVVAYQSLQKHYSPQIVLLVGIAGGISPKVTIGDVVISDEIIYYDARRESPEGVHRRGQSYPIAPVLRHRLNEFFRVHGAFHSPGDADRAAPPFRVHRGPVGSGDVVVTDRESGIRSWLLTYHEKALAVETEAGGIAQAFYEEVGDDRALRGWLTIRGISDHADAGKGDSYHDLAAERAALVLERLVPFLILAGASG
jgi:adenosylhomocysteine nucleosidase